MFEMSHEMTLSVIVTYLLLVSTVVSLYLPSIVIGKKRYSIWPFIYLLSVSAAFFSQIIDLIALVSLIGMAVISFYFQKAKSFRLRWIYGIAMGFLFLLLSFHLVPGFENTQVFSNQMIKENSTLSAMYLRFDKTSAGILVLALVIGVSNTRSQWRLNFRASWQSYLSFSILTLLVAIAFGMIEFTTTFHASGLFVFAFFMKQLFSVALVEEVFFRGLLQEKLYSLFNPGSWKMRLFPLLISSALFGLVHFGGGWHYMVVSIIAGLGYGLAYQISRRIEAAIIAHVALNMTHLIFFTYPLKM